MKSLKLKWSLKDYCMNCDNRPNGKKIAFIHIPRTGGKSVRYYFDLGYHDKEYNRHGHYSCAHRRASVVWSEKIINDFDTFSVIRDPWSRLVSLFHYYSGRPDMKQPYNIIEKYKNKFSDFILDLKNIPIASYRDEQNKNDNKQIMLPDNFQSCSYFICDDSPEKKVLVKNLIRFNNYNDDLKSFAKKVGLDVPIPLPKIDKRKSALGLDHKYYTEYYSTDGKLIQSVADIYKNDINVFGFNFGD